jgi:hypothetical protein
MHRAGTALGDPAAVFRSGEPNLLTQDPEEWRVTLDIEPMRGPVDQNGDHDAVPMRPVFLPRGRLALNLAALLERQASTPAAAGLAGTAAAEIACILTSAIGWQSRQIFDLNFSAAAVASTAPDAHPASSEIVKATDAPALANFRVVAR